MKNKKMLLIAIVAFIVLAGGASAYSFLIRSGGEDKKETAPVEETAILPLEPMIVNLVDPTDPSGKKFVKVALQFELVKTPETEQAKNRVAQIKDAVIMLITSKQADFLKSPEGKLIFKDELNAAVSHILGEKIVKNVYITDFVMQ